MTKRKDTRPSLRAVLRHFNACDGAGCAMPWVERMANRPGMTTQRMWDECREASWMSWVVTKAFGFGSETDIIVYEAARERWSARDVHRAITWPEVERALLDRYLRETGGAQ